MQMQTRLAQGVAILDNHAQRGCTCKDACSVAVLDGHLAQEVAVLDNHVQCGCAHKDARGVAVLDGHLQIYEEL